MIYMLRKYVTEEETKLIASINNKQTNQTKSNKETINKRAKIIISEVRLNCIGIVAVSRCFKFISIELSFKPLHFIYYLHLRQLHAIFCFVEI